MTKTKPEQKSDSRADSETRTSLSLIVGAQEKDSEAWDRIVKLYSPMVFYWCNGSGLAESDLHDVFQEVFHQLARSIHLFRPIENGSFRGWLRTLTRNKLADHFRKQGREPRPMGGTEALKYFEQFPDNAKQVSEGSKHESSTSQQENPFSSELDVQHSMLCQALANIREHFAPQTFKAFWMVVIDGREANDVAKDLSMRPGTVRVAKSRVLKRLRLEIGDAVE